MTIKHPGIVIAIVVGLFLRLTNLNQSLWLDEAINVLAATNYSPLYLISTYSLGDFHPPMFHLVLYFWIGILDNRETWVRLPSVFFGLIAVIYTYALAESFFRRASFEILRYPVSYATLVALLLSTSGLHIYYSQEARMYSFAAMAVVMSAYYLLPYLEKTHHLSLHKWWNQLKVSWGQLGKPSSIMLVFSLWLILMSDYVAYLMLPLVLILAPIQLIVAGILSAWWLPLFWIQLNQGLTTASDYPVWGQVVGGLSAKNIALIPVKFIIGRTNLEPSWLYGLVVLVLGAIFLGLIGYGVYKRVITQPKAESIVTFAYLVFPLLIGVVLSLRVSLLSYFRFLFLLPFFYLWLVCGLKYLRPKWRMVLVILVVGVNLVTSAMYLTQEKFHRENWRGLASWLKSQEQVDRLMLIPNLAQADPFVYYAPDIRIVDNLDTLDRLPAKIYYIRYVVEIFDSKENLLNQLHELGYTKTDERMFNGVLVWTFQPDKKEFAMEIY